MAGKAITKDTIKKNTVKDMRKLGVYKAEYDPIIEIYSEMREQYERLTKEFKMGGYEYSIETMQGGSKKSPLVATLESLRKDILQYSDRLCLNPKANLDKQKEKEQKKKGLAEVLKSIG